MNLASLSAVAALTLVGCAGTPAKTTTPEAVSAGVAIDRAAIETAQRDWCRALVAIGAESTTGGDPAKLARDVLSAAYDYDHGTVLFKPTLTYGEQTFRLDKRGALSYFVGGDDMYPSDKGFARKPWVTCEPKVAGVVINGSFAVAMGNVYFTDSSGGKVMVDKTFGYLRGKDGQLRIVLHHSSLPYTPAATTP